MMDDKYLEAMVKLTELAGESSNGEATDALALICDALALALSAGDYNPDDAFSRVTESFDMLMLAKHSGGATH